MSCPAVAPGVSRFIPGRAFAERQTRTLAAHRDQNDPMMKRKLLVIDDEPAIQLILEHYFAHEYEVVLTANGRDAMAWLEQGHQVDIIVADYEMPFMNGLDFIRALRQSATHRHTPLMMLSVTDDVHNKITCLRQGADDYLVKPFNPEELEVRINKILDRVGA
jgi:DNA-binding response OmpR family regulator